MFTWHEPAAGFEPVHYEDGSRQLLPFPGAEILRHHDTRSHTDSHKKHDQQVEDRPGGVMGILKKFIEPVDMTEGSPWQKIVLFAVPMLVGNIAQQLYNTVISCYAFASKRF